MRGAIATVPMIGWAMVAAASTAVAQQENSFPPPVDEQWKLRFEPAAWYVGFSGDLTLPTNLGASPATEKRNIDTLDLDDPQIAPLLELHVSKNDWTVSLRGFFSNAEGTSTGLTGAIGNLEFVTDDTLRSSIDAASIELEVAYCLRERRMNRDADGVHAFGYRVDVLGGVRLYSISADIARTNPLVLFPEGTVLSESADEIFIEPQVGAKLTMVLYEQVTVDLTVSLGGNPLGDNNSFSFDIIAGFAWQPTPNFGVQIGYRSLIWGLEAESETTPFEWSGAAQGLYGGVVLTF